MLRENMQVTAPLSLYIVRYPKGNLPNRKHIIETPIDDVIAASATSQLQQTSFIFPFHHLARVTPPALLHTDPNAFINTAMTNMKGLVQEIIMGIFQTTPTDVKPYVDALTSKRFLVVIANLNGIDVDDLDQSEPRTYEDVWGDHLKMPGKALARVIKSRFGQLYALNPDGPILAKAWLARIVTPTTVSIIAKRFEAQDREFPVKPPRVSPPSP